MRPHPSSDRSSEQGRIPLFDRVRELERRPVGLGLGDVPTKTVSFQDLDLSTAHGAQALYDRIEASGGPIAGGVITYEQKGKLYVAVAIGHSGGSIPLAGSAIFGL